MGEQKRIRILIADDHSVVRAGLAALLSAEDDLSVAGYAKNGREAVTRTLELHPDVVIMDLEMPQTDGVAATAEIAAQAPRTRVLISDRGDSRGRGRQDLPFQRRAAALPPRSARAPAFATAG